MIKERARVNLWFHKTFHDELEMWLISENNRATTEAPLGTSTLLRKAPKVTLFKWTELVSLRSLMMQNSTGEFADKSEKEDTSGQVLLAFVVSKHISDSSGPGTQLQLPRAKNLRGGKINTNGAHPHGQKRGAGDGAWGTDAYQITGTAKKQLGSFCSQSTFKSSSSATWISLPLLDCHVTSHKDFAALLPENGIIIFHTLTKPKWDYYFSHTDQDTTGVQAESGNGETHSIWYHKQVPGAGQVLRKCWDSAPPAKSMQNHQAFVCVWVGLHKH